MIVNRLMHASQMTRDKDLSALLKEAADLIENLQTWKIRWAERDLAYAHLYEEYRLACAQLNPTQIDSIHTMSRYKRVQEELMKQKEENKS
jgi:hypothetical protein